MRKVIIVAVLVVSGMVLPGCGNPNPFANPVPEQGPFLGRGRIERPADGFAVTLPADWGAHEPLPSEGLGRWGRPLGRLGGHLSLFAGIESGQDSCYVHVNERPTGDPTSLDEYVELSLDDLRSDGGVEVGEVTRSRIDLAAGPSEVLDTGWAREYLLMHGGTFYAFGCFVPDGTPPEDRWLSIAQTIEFLPEAP